MKKVLFLITVLYFSNAYSQADSMIARKRIFPNNYVAPFGLYVSQELGIGGANDMGALSILTNITIAYKCYSITFTGGGSQTMLNPYIYYNTQYFGVLAGYSWRTNYSYFSISTGLASTDFEAVHNSSHYRTFPRFPYHEVLSIPVEIKFFFLAHYLAGLGAHFSVDIIPNTKYAPFYFGPCIVLGAWNKPKFVFFPSSRFEKIKNNFYKPSFKPANEEEKSLTKLGHYFSIGKGYTFVDDFNVDAIHVSYSLALKSHLFTISATSNQGSVNSTDYFSGSQGFLFGESFRSKNGLVSLSTGISRSREYRRLPDSQFVLGWRKPFVSFPIEMKAILHLYNLVGLGAVLSANISPKEHSLFYMGISLVGGYWNKGERVSTWKKKK